MERFLRSGSEVKRLPFWRERSGFRDLSDIYFFQYHPLRAVFFHMKKKPDIRDLIFLKVKGMKFLAEITSQRDGILSGIHWLQGACRDLGINLEERKENGTKVRRSEVVAVLKGNPKQMALAEEELIGWIAKSSGIATAARKARAAAGRRLKVVSGAWKKMPAPIKDLIREAILDGGIYYRISEKPFIYLDKNYVRILGGVKEALLSIRNLKRFTKIIQLKSKGKRLCQEALVASQLGAHIIMIDTGKKEDVKRVDLVLREQRLRRKVKIAYGGNIRIEDLKKLKEFPVDIVDIGKAIVDAPLLDMRMDIIESA
jgi:nicotinate-nucleotide pyrophosphorylase (carboxylating)